MREMKDSGIEWIGEIPKDWEIRKLKHYYKLQTGFTPDTKNQLYYDDENGYDWLTISDLNTSKYIPKNTKSKISDYYLSQFNPDIITKGSLLYSFKLSVGQVAFADRDIYSNEAIASFINDDSVNLNFLYYSSFMIVKNANENIYGAKLLNQDLIRNAKIIFPPLPTQQRIADYLDKQCAEIDAVIEKTKSTIEEYKKLKQSIITEAVTKGLNPNAEMKDSGIEWIGWIPKHWRLRQFRYILDERSEKNSPIQSTERLSLSIELGVTLYSEKTTNLDRFKDDFEQYKLAYPGDLVMNSMNMIVGATGVSEYFGCVSPVYYTFFDKVEDHITAKFCEHIFRSKAMLKVLFSMGKGIYAIQRGDDRINTCRLKVPKQDLKSMLLPIPSIDEQRNIVEFIKQKNIEINNIIAQKQSIITELESYKKSLIYECVTGKKEV